MEEGEHELHWRWGLVEVHTALSPVFLRKRKQTEDNKIVNFQLIYCMHHVNYSKNITRSSQYILQLLCTNMGSLSGGGFKPASPGKHAVPPVNTTVLYQLLSAVNSASWQ